MTRLFFCLLTLLVCCEANADWTLGAGGYYYNGSNVPHTRSAAYKCCTSGTGWCYQYTPVYSPPQANVTNQSYVYNYTISYAQPAAAQGETLYGYAPQLSLQSYGAIDLGATIDGLLRLSGDLNAGAQSVAGDAKDLASDAAAFVTANNQAVAAVAEIQAKAELLKAAQPSPQLNLKVGAAVGGNQVFAAGAPGPLVTQHCANCHADGKKGAETFGLAALATDDGRKAATVAIATGEMPKGVELDAATRLALIAEICGK